MPELRDKGFYAGLRYLIKDKKELLKSTVSEQDSEEDMNPMSM